MLNKDRLLTISYKILMLLPLFALLLLDISCYREPINIDLSDFENNIVIEGSITDRLGTHSVRITRTIKYNGNDDFPAVSGALVKVEDDLDNFYPFYEKEPGVYQASSIRGIPGRTYTLTVMVDDEKYTASSTMPEPMLLKALNFNNLEPTDYIFEISCTFADRAGIEDYCLLNVYLNGYFIDFYLYQDNMTDGKDITLDDFDFVFYQNDYVNIELITLDQAAYEFYRTLDKIHNSENEDDEFAASILPVTSFNPTTNLDNGALGFFSAHTVRKYTRSFN